MGNIYGRQVVIPLTNKSGGGVVAGDVVIIDTGNDSAFTTTTTGQYGGSVGIAQETIANNATGRVLVHGEAALVNVPSSMTRGRFLETHTVAKQGTQNTTRRAGSFGQFTTGGTTPKAWLWGFPDNAGAAGETVATSAIWTTAGKVAVATGTATATEQWPPGHEFDYVEFTSPVNITATSEATANTVVTGNLVTYDGSTIVIIEFFAHRFASRNTTSGDYIEAFLYDGSSSIGYMGIARCDGSASNTVGQSILLRRRITPSNAAHTYSVRCDVNASTGVVAAGAGGNGNLPPGYIRITKV